MRGFAALLIIIWHYGQNQLVNNTTQASVYVKMITTYFWSGVDLFLVLSGFLLGGILIDNKTSKNYFKAFYTRRFYRILPVYIATLLLVFIICQFGVGNKTEYSFNAAVPFYSYVILVQNIFMGINQSFGNHWLAHTWSLGLEEQFYILLPLLIYFFKRKYLVVILVACSIAALLLRFYINNRFGSANYIFCRFDSLFCGVLAAMALRNESIKNWMQKNTKLLTGIATLMLFITAAFSFRLLHINYYASNTWFAIMYALLILVIVTGKNFYAAIFSNKLLVYFGMISYGMYLLHPVILALLHFLISKQAPQLNNWFDVTLTVIAFALTVLFAHISYNYLEKLFIKKGHKTKY